MTLLTIDFSHLPTSVMWVVFGVIVVTMLILDLKVFNRNSDEPTMKSTGLICLVYVAIACLFGLFVYYEKGVETAMQFYTGYLVEFSLSIDNIFVMSLIFSTLLIPARFQRRVLFWGILGAVLMRAGMIALGSTIVAQYHWVLYIFSAFLIYTGAKLISNKEETDFKEGRVYKILQKKLRITPEISGQNFVVKKEGKNYLTPLFLALIMIELMDVVFALDSIPAIFLISEDMFVVYTSNIFAILGLRSLYFLLSGMVNKFDYLKYSLALVLIFIGLKIFLPFIGWHVGAGASLIITFVILTGGVVASLIKGKRTTKEV